MSRRDDYLTRLEHARREAARCTDPEQKAMWATIADQWEALARQVRDLDGWPDPKGGPGGRTR
jgi:hypothetical protein